MRTNETARLADGGYASVAELAWAVARTLDYLHPYVERGATREEVLSGDAPVDEDAERRWVEASRELARVRGLSVPAAAVEQAQEALEAWRGWSAFEVNRVRQLARVTQAIGEVELWRAAGAEVAALRDRLLEDLDDTRRWLTPTPRPDAEPPLTVAEWLARRTAAAERRVERRFSELATARLNAEATNRFVADLRDLVGEPPPPPAPPKLATENGRPLTREGGFV